MSAFSTGTALRLSPRPRAAQAIGLVGWLLVTFAAAGIGALASAQAGSFYGDLQRPAWAPPGWLFAPVWNALYLMMAVAAWLVWRAAPRLPTVAPALWLYLLQLFANALWTWLYFVWRLGGLAFAENLLLALLIAATIGAFRRHSGRAALLLMPYLGWVIYAAALTFETWRLNPDVLGRSGW